jgi:hypothetical protein
MGRSSAFTPGPADSEDFSAATAQFEGSSGVLYKVEKRGDQVIHHEIGLGGPDAPPYDQSVPVSLAIGSGTRGKSYAINRDGLLFMSPISWYSRDGGYFQFSPGYERNKSEAGFERRLVAGCIHCHAGRMVPHPEQPERLAPPYFHEVSISCERCHGPGQKHMERQERMAVAAPDDSIVNPARLTPSKREAVCNQCHLHGEYVATRYGRKPYDFRPGMELDDVLLVFVGDDGFNELGQSTAVSQVEQMHSSTCFRESGGKLGCASCHNPHRKETDAERVEFHRANCLACHAERGCSLPLEEQQEAPASGSCIHCHMPASSASDIVHASQTDHRILRDPLAEMAPPAARRGDPYDHWKLFGGAEDRIPDWELQRARALALVYAASAGKAGRNRLGEVEDMLLPLSQVPLEDDAVFYALSQAARGESRIEDSLSYLSEAVRLSPQSDMYLEMMARTCSELSQDDEALKYLDRTLALNPWHARNHVLRAELLAKRGDRSGALEAAREAFTLNPGLGNLSARIERLLEAAGK